MSTDAALPPIALPGGRVVPDQALRERAVTSGGPGGQHVNKTATRVELRIQLAALPLTEREQEMLRERLGSRLTRGGELVLASDSSRSQLDNRRDVRRRAERLLTEGLARQRTRVPTRVSRGALERLRQHKTRTSQRKAARRWRPSDDA